MVGDQRAIDCAIVRGGTSKGVLVPRTNLPAENQDEAILSLFGSPDDRQIGGLGGATSTTSNLVVISQSDGERIKIDYTFGQVGVENAVVDYGDNCGNLTCAIGSFAVDEGMVPVSPDDDTVTVELYNTNTSAEIAQTVQLCDGRAASVGEFKIHGVPRAGAKIDTTFHDPVGAMTDCSRLAARRSRSMSTGGNRDDRAQRHDTNSFRTRGGNRTYRHRGPHGDRRRREDPQTARTGPG
jgi:2-methylaconitate cis-trans-isomerase PrpF